MKTAKVGGQKPYRFMQENLDGFLFQLSSRNDGPADGPVGKVKEIGFLIQRSGEFF